MNVITHASAVDFKARAWPFLVTREAENNLILGVAGRLAEIAEQAVRTAPGAAVAPAAAGGATPMFWTVEQGNAVVAAAMITPPHRLVLTQGAQDAIVALCDHVHRSGASLPGVMGPREPAEWFGAWWCALRGCALRQSHALCVYQLDRVQPVTGVPGRMDLADLDDVDLLTRWGEAFAADVNLQHPPAREAVRQAVEARQRWLWRDPLPVSMASAVGPTPSGIRIGSVYTPPEHRRRGYASALVAALSQIHLDADRQFCFLFTDLANPTSNSIYQRIGYRAVSFFGEYDFLQER